jgi:hypothetical protein
MRNQSMKKLLISLCVLITSTAFYSNDVDAKELDFGQPINQDAKVQISKLLADAPNFMNKEVTVEGTIVGVCSHRGCWAELASDVRFEKLRIKVRDGDMVFPMHAKGRTALATGKLTAINLSLKQTQKYKASLAKRRGEEFDINTVTEGMTIYQLSPTGVKILES